LANTAEQYGIGEYRFAHNYELCGQKFELKAGDKVCVLEFAGGHPDGGFKATLDGVEAEWECEKLEKDLYFVRLGDTALYSYYDALRVLPEDTLILLTRGWVMGSSGNAETYESYTRLYRAMVDFKTP
jgi:hypothetical protein